MQKQTLAYALPAQQSRRTWTRPQVKRILILAAILVPLEIGAAILAYHTIGEITSGLYFMLVMGNLLVVPIVFLHYRTALVGVLLLGLLIIPWQMWLGVRWIRVHAEAQRIVRHVEVQKAATGRYPADLSGYRFRDAWMKDLIHYTGRPFHLSYSIGSQGTSHWYEMTSRSWEYYPD